MVPISLSSAIINHENNTAYMNSYNCTFLHLRVLLIYIDCEFTPRYGAGVTWYPNTHRFKINIVQCFQIVQSFLVEINILESAPIISLEVPDLKTSNEIDAADSSKWMKTEYICTYIITEWKYSDFIDASINWRYMCSIEGVSLISRGGVCVWINFWD